MKDLKQAKYLQAVLRERFDLSTAIVEGQKLTGAGWEPFALLQDPNGFRYTIDEIQCVLYFLRNFEERKGL